MSILISKKYRNKKIALNLVKKAFFMLKKQNIKTVYFQIPKGDRELVNKFLEYDCEIINEIKKYGGWLILKKNLAI